MPDNMSEVWMDVVGYEGFYKVSDLGRVMSLPRKVLSKEYTLPGSSKLIQGKWYTVREKILKQAMGQFYHHVVLSKDNVETTRTVHSLVLEAFQGPAPEVGMVCRHLDGNPLNNNTENLRWGTYQENSDDKLLHGTADRGPAKHRAKHYKLKSGKSPGGVTKFQCLEILRLHDSGTPAEGIVEQLKVPVEAVTFVVSKRWKRYLYPERFNKTEQGTEEISYG